MKVHMTSKIDGLPNILRYEAPLAGVQLSNVFLRSIKRMTLVATLLVFKRYMYQLEEQFW